jgi:hypothetical protein
MARCQQSTVVLAVRWGHSSPGVCMALSKSKYVTQNISTYIEMLFIMVYVGNQQSLCSVGTIRAKTII